MEAESRKRRLRRLRGHTATIGERFERDHAAMLPLPAAPYEACEKIAGRVSSLSLVRYRSQEHLSLQVRTAGGQVLDAQGGVQIIDISAELGADGIEVHAMGIGYPPLRRTVPDHVAAYHIQFPSKR